MILTRKGINHIGISSPAFKKKEVDRDHLSLQCLRSITCLSLTHWAPVCYSQSVSTAWVPFSIHKSSMMELWVINNMKIIAFMSRTALWGNIQEPSDEWLNYQDLLSFCSVKNVPWEWQTGREWLVPWRQRLSVPPTGYLPAFLDPHFQMHMHKFYPPMAFPFMLLVFPHALPTFCM